MLTPVPLFSFSFFDVFDMIYIWPKKWAGHIAETRVFLCSGKPPLSWSVSNTVGYLKTHYRHSGDLSPKCALFRPNNTGTCKIICYDRRGQRAETSLIRVFKHDKFTDKRFYAGIPLGIEVRKQLGKTVIFRRRNRKQEKYAYHTPSNPRRLDKQQPWRLLFASAMASALALSPEDREKWRKENLSLCWFNNYIKHYLKQQPKPW
jgi:hypothetical protein